MNSEWKFVHMLPNARLLFPAVKRFLFSLIIMKRNSDKEAEERRERWKRNGFDHEAGYRA